VQGQRGRDRGSMSKKSQRGRKQWWKSGNMIKKIAISIAVLLFIHVWIQGVEAAQGKEIVVVFRMDDYSETSNTEMELRIIEAFRHHNIPITIAVIPAVVSNGSDREAPLATLGEKKAAILREGYAAGLIDIALHGYTHQTYSPMVRSEFEGLAYEIQKEKISKGKKLLEEMTGAWVLTFVPPWNSYDDNTLAALASMNFVALSGSLANRSDLHARLSYLPATCELDDVKKAVIAARQSPDQRPCVVALFHIYDFIDVNPESGSVQFAEFARTLAWLKAQRDVRFSTISKEASKIRDFTAGRLVLNSDINGVLSYLPFSSQKDHYYYTKHDEHYYYAWLKVGIFYLSVLLAVILLSFTAGKQIAAKAPAVLHASRYGALLLFLMVIGYALHDLEIHAKGLIACVVMLGLTGGIWMSSFACQRKRKK
jgi:peptidoglycan/xylan/chitin deacetylase (PgdA/CDA1 family)